MAMLHFSTFLKNQSIKCVKLWISNIHKHPHEHTHTPNAEIKTMENYFIFLQNLISFHKYYTYNKEQRQQQDQAFFSRYRPWNCINSMEQYRDIPKYQILKCGLLCERVTKMCCDAYSVKQSHKVCYKQ